MSQDSTVQSIVTRYRAQVGEYLWHAFTGSEHIAAKTERFYKLLSQVMENYFKGQRISILELAPSKNYIAYYLAENADVTVMDMSRHALVEGKSIASECGLNGNVRMVASDFHSLPFENGEFDLVYMSGAIHHCKNPSVVFDEVARILKPNGLFYLINEPCKREFSLYEFNCNRVGGGAGRTKFEEELNASGVLGVFSYPVDGGRPEDLFEMTENWSIPIITFTCEQSTYFNLLTEVYENTPLTPYEEQLIQSISNDQKGLAKSICQDIKRARDNASHFWGLKEKYMGFSLSSDAKIEQLAEKISQLLVSNAETLKSGLQAERDKLLTSIFGGRVTCLYQRNTQINPASKLRSLPNEPQPTGEFLVPMTEGEFALDLAARILPDIQTDDAATLQKLYQPSGWQYTVEADGKIISLLNTKNSAAIEFDQPVQNAILLIRYYGIEIDEPYIISAYLNDTLLFAHNIVRSETRSFIGGFKSIHGVLRFELTTNDGKPIELPGHLRLGVLQIIQLQRANKNG